MVQFARPQADLTTDAQWTTTPYWSKLDEGAPGGTDPISNGGPSSADVIALDLSGVTDPTSSTGHTLRACWSKTGAQAGGSQVTVELRQGYVNESSQGTLIATLSGVDTTADGDQTDTYGLSGAEADAITDYSDLQLRVHIGREGNPSQTARASQVQFLELEVPDASGGGTHYDDSDGAFTMSFAATGEDTLHMAESGEFAATALVTGSDALHMVEAGEFVAASSVNGADSLHQHESGVVEMSVAIVGADALHMAEAGEFAVVIAVEGEDHMHAVEDGRFTIVAIFEGSDIPSNLDIPNAVAWDQWIEGRVMRSDLAGERARVAKD